MNDIKMICIADDEEINLLLAETLIRSILPEASILVANSGEEALEVAKEYNPQLIFLDINMPGGIDGFETAYAIRAFETENEMKHAYIVALSAAEASEMNSKISESGIDSFISKPLKKAEVEKAISYIRNDGKETLSEQLAEAKRFNLQSLKERLVGNEDMIGDVIEAGILSISNAEENIQIVMNNAENSFTSDDIEKLKQWTHKLCGVTITVGFEKLNKISSELNQRLSIKDDSALPLFNDLMAEIEEVKRTDYSVYV
jgi:CheY-like chemotaxis protein